MISRTSSIIPQLLREYHDSAMGGHLGETKTYLKMRSEWFWVGMKGQIEQYVRECHICQQQKASYRLGLLQSLPVPSQVWEDITMDFVEALPKSKGWDTVFVVVDMLTKYAHFVGLRHPFTAASVAAEFVKEVVRLHGFPMSIVFDRDKISMSTFWKELFRLQGTNLLRSTAYHPQTDGQTEIVNKALETYGASLMGSPISGRNGCIGRILL